jgi:hypothetical protein
VISSEPNRGKSYAVTLAAPFWHRPMTAHWDIAGILTTVFMVFAVCYTATRAHLDLSASMGTSRLLGFVVAVFGLGTFFMPLVRASPAVLGKADWSSRDVLSGVYGGQLRYSAVAFDVVATYLLMLAAFAVLFLPQPRKPLLMIGILGVICSSWALEMGHWSLFHWFSRSAGTLTAMNVSYGPAMYAIEVVVSMLLLISVIGAEEV